MRVKYYFSFFIVFIIVFCGGFYTLSQSSGDITLSVFGHSATQHAVIWIAFGISIFFLFIYHPLKYLIHLKLLFQLLLKILLDNVFLIIFHVKIFFTKLNIIYNSILQLALLLQHFLPWQIHK